MHITSFLRLAFQVEPTQSGPHRARYYPAKNGERQPYLGHSPPIRDELAKLGVEGSTATIGRYRAKLARRPSQSWQTFLQTIPSWW
jgi:hypothetical protein